MNKREEFIRDVTSVTPLPKSEVRRRLDDILFEQREKIEVEWHNHIWEIAADILKGIGVKRIRTTYEKRNKKTTVMDSRKV